MKILFSLFLLISSLATYAGVEAEFGIYSNFIWRGTTFTENKPAVQATLDAEEQNGFFVNGFVSNAEFADDVLSPNSQVSQEVDYGAGKRFYFQEDSFIQFAYYRYTFPGAGAFDTNDFNIEGKWKNFIFELSYMDEFFGYRGAYYYYKIGYIWSFKNDLELGATVGYNVFKNPKGEIKNRCMDTGCIEVAETLNGAASKNYFDVFIVGSKKIQNNQKLEIAVNITDREEYVVENGEIDLTRAKDFAAIAAWSININLF